MAYKTVVNVKTGQSENINLTPEEEADAAVRFAAEQSDIRLLELRALRQLHSDTKSSAMFQAIKSATYAQIETWIDNNFPGMTAQQRALLKVLAAVAGAYLRER